MTEEDLGQEVPLATSTTHLTASVDSLRLQDDHQTSLSGEAPAENRATHESDSPSEGSNQQLKLSKDERSDVSEIPDLGALKEGSKDLIGNNSEQSEPEIRPDDVD